MVIAFVIRVSRLHGNWNAPNGYRRPRRGSGGENPCGRVRLTHFAVRSGAPLPFSMVLAVRNGARLLTPGQIGDRRPSLRASLEVNPGPRPQDLSNDGLGFASRAFRR